MRFLLSIVYDERQRKRLGIMPGRHGLVLRGSKSMRAEPRLTYTGLQ